MCLFKSLKINSSTVPALGIPLFLIASARALSNSLNFIFSNALFPAPTLVEVFVTASLILGQLGFSFKIFLITLMLSVFILNFFPYIFSKILFGDASINGFLLLLTSSIILFTPFAILSLNGEGWLINLDF